MPLGTKIIAVRVRLVVKLLPSAATGKQTGSYDFNAELEWNVKIH